MKELREAAAKGDLESVKIHSLILQSTKQGLDQPDDNNGKTALHLAAEKNHKEVVRWLLETGANVDAVDTQGNTPIFYAVPHLDLELVQLFTNKKAKLILPINAEMAKTPISFLIKLKKKLEADGKEEPSYLLAIRQLLHANLRTEVNQRLHAAHLLGEGKFLQITPEGDIRFFASPDALKKAANAVGSSNQKAFMRSGTAANPQSITFNYNAADKKLTRELEHTVSPYVVPPLVFLLDEDDGTAVYDLLVNNNFFQHLGYSTVCYEFDDNKNLAETIAAFKKSIANAPPLSKIAKKNQQSVNFLEQIQKQSSLSYVGIDLVKGDARSVDVVAAMDVKTTGELIEKRGIHLAKQMTKQANQYQGGTITIVGLQPDIQLYLSRFAPIQQHKFLFCHCYSGTSSTYKTDPDFKQTKLLYPLGLTLLDTRKGFDEVGKTLFDVMIKKMPTMISLVDYTEWTQLTEDSGALTKVKALFSPNFKGFLDKDHNVDALLLFNRRTVDETMVHLAQRVNDVIKCHPKYPVRIVRLSDQTLALRIPRINEENSKPIQDAPTAILHAAGIKVTKSQSASAAAAATVSETASAASQVAEKKDEKSSKVKQ